MFYGQTILSTQFFKNDLAYDDRIILMANLLPTTPPPPPTKKQLKLIMLKYIRTSYIYKYLTVAWIKQMDIK